MFRSIASLALAATALCAAVLPAQAQDDAKAPFQARYTELRSAMEAHDAAAMGKILAPEYKVTDMRGETHSGAEMMERMAKMAQRAPDPSRKAEITVLAATITGDTAIVDQQLTAGGKRAGDDGKDHTMEMTMKSKDVWARRADAWVLVNSVQTGMTVKRDGEVFFTQGN